MATLNSCIGCSVHLAPRLFGLVEWTWPMKQSSPSTCAPLMLTAQCSSWPTGCFWTDELLMLKCHTNALVSVIRSSCRSIFVKFIHHQTWIHQMWPWNNQAVQENGPKTAWFPQCPRASSWAPHRTSVKQGSRSARLSPQSMIHYARKLFIIVTIVP